MLALTVFVSFFAVRPNFVHYQDLLSVSSFVCKCDQLASADLTYVSHYQKSVQADIGFGERKGRPGGRAPFFMQARAALKRAAA